MEKRANCPIILVIVFGASTDFRGFYTEGCTSLPDLQFFFNIVQNPFDPRFEHLVDFS